MERGSTVDRDLQALQEVRDCLLRAREAARALRTYSQSRIDTICRAMAMAGSREAERLAKLAVEETGMGVVASKIQKNRVASELLWDAIKDMKTVGVIGRDDNNRVYEIAAPMGTVAAIIPTTNPTSTAIYKSIIALKARNPIVVSPHPRAVRCIAESCRVVGEAAERAGAPRHAVQCLTNVTLEATQALMSHPLTGVILATGGMELVRAAYSSGKPALGVGAGNPPAIVDVRGDVPLAARMIVASQTFDNGTICSSEQSIICLAPVKEQLLSELVRLRCHLCSPEEIKLLEKIVVRGRRQNPAIVGQYPRTIAKMAGFEVPHDTTVLICEYSGVGWEHPLSIEKLSPILALYTVRDLEEAARLADELLRFGGDGHTLAIHTRDEEAVMRLADLLPACRILVNAPTSQGSVGFATALFPSMTLGCGTFGNNISSNNISPRDLLNIKRVAWVREEMTREDFDPDAYFREVRARAYGVVESAEGAPGPVRPYLHPKVAGGGQRQDAAAGALPRLSREELEKIVSRGLAR
ncbi:MAG: aldehyde dehydrogenase [Planctomycetota bacterium]|nr:MAG: aldehyde dehydrogenase [Planctomycetota bacterium]